MITFADFIHTFALFSVGYFFFVNTFYLFLILSSLWALRAQAKIKPLAESLRKGKLSFAPPISILAPAYNEQETITESVQSFLLLNYPNFEVVVVNDGSKDKTMERLKAAFMLEPILLNYDDTLSRTEVRATYRSKLHPNLTVIDKENGGKADALNVGIGYAQHDLFCCVDSDSLLENDALVKVAAPFFERPAKLIASGGTIRIANGANIRFGRVESVDLPKNFLVLMQVIEYTRAFLCGRIGWNVFNSTLVISGAFGLFSKNAVREIGGYTAGCIGEDMELIIRLHKHFRLHKKPYQITFVADPVCWTEAPADRRSLAKQRDRWQRGLADTLIRNREMIFNPKYGFIGWMALPYFLFVDLLGPIFEMASLLIIGSAFFLGGFDGPLFFTFLTASILYSAVLSMCSVVIEEIYFAKYHKPHQFLVLFLVCMVESVWYRQMSTYWRLKGLVKYLRGDHSWGHLQRAGFNTHKKAS